MSRGMEPEVIDVAKDFTRYPAGRYRDDGPYSGQRFREDLLVPVLEKFGRATVVLDGTMGYGSSFLEEVFGGLRRDNRFATADLRAMIKLISKDTSLIGEIGEYMDPRLA